MFKKPFNKKVGETRKCKDCSEDFHTMKPLWRCRKCTSKFIFESAKRRTAEGHCTTGTFAGQPFKKAYPFSNKTNEANARFARIRKELNECWTREERREFFQKQIDEIQSNGIWEWILDRRDDATARKKRPKSKTRMENDWPDTRGGHE